MFELGPGQATYCPAKGYSRIDFSMRSISTLTPSPRFSASARPRFRTRVGPEPLSCRHSRAAPAGSVTCARVCAHRRTAIPGVHCLDRGQPCRRHGASTYCTSPARLGVATRKRAPDQPWFGNVVELLAEKRGDGGQRADRPHRKVDREYPFPGQYVACPDPTRTPLSLTLRG